MYIKKGVITLAGTRGEREYNVKANILGSFAAHEPLLYWHIGHKKLRKTQWLITHIPTGHHTIVTDNKEKALKILRYFKNKGDQTILSIGKLGEPSEILINEVQRILDLYQSTTVKGKSK